jgi:3-dehydroquinate synthetase
MQLDKKAEAGKLRFVLLRKLGDAYVTSNYDAATLDALLGAAENE